MNPWSIIAVETLVILLFISYLVISSSKFVKGVCLGVGLCMVLVMGIAAAYSLGLIVGEKIKK